MTDGGNSSLSLRKKGSIMDLRKNDFFVHEVSQASRECASRFFLRTILAIYLGVKALCLGIFHK